MDNKDAAYWPAYRARLEAARIALVKATISGQAGATSARAESPDFEVTNIRLDAARSFSPPKLAHQPTKIQKIEKIQKIQKIEMSSPKGAGDVPPDLALSTPRVNGESNYTAAASHLEDEVPHRDDPRDYEGSNEVAAISVPPVSAVPPAKSKSASGELTIDVAVDARKSKLLPPVEVASRKAEAEIGELQTTSGKTRTQNGYNSLSRKAQKTLTTEARYKRRILMRRVLNCLATNPSLSAAANKLGIYPKTLAHWLKRSRAGDSAYELVWQGFRLPFHEHCEEAKDQAFDKLCALAWEWTQERIVYKTDELLLSLGYEGPAAYLRDAEGMPIVETILRRRPAMIRWLLEVWNPGKWGKQVVSSHPGVAASIKTRNWQAKKRSLDKKD